MNNNFADLHAVTDLLAKVIAFLLQYKSIIPKAVITTKLFDDAQRAVFGGTLDKLEDYFASICNDNGDETSIVAKSLPLLVRLDQLIEEKMLILIRDNSLFLGESSFLKLENGINSQKSRNETNIMILPRWTTGWEGSGDDKEIVSDSFNRFLKHSRYVGLRNGLVDGKYLVNCYFLSKMDAIHYEGIERHEGSMKIGMSPMSIVFNLDDDNLESNPEFHQKPWEDSEKDKIKKIVFKVVEEAEKNRVNILVFPEMMGYDSLEDEVCDYLTRNEMKYLKLLVLPSVSTVVDVGYVNHSCLVHAGYGEKILIQKKLVAFANNTKVEGIVSDNTFNLLYDEVHGCVGILICKTALEESVRRVAINELGVKLLICPSWSEGTHAFMSFLKATEEWNCNVVWVNTCSALKNKEENFGKEPVCALTRYYKKKGYSRRTAQFYPIKDCGKECMVGKPCLFVSEIKRCVK